MYIPGTIIYIKYIKYELHRKYRTYLFKVYMASAVVHISAGSKPAKIWSRSTQRITADFC